MCDFAFLRVWYPACSCLEGECLFSTFDVEKPAALFSFLNVNKVRKKINKCRDLKDKFYGLHIRHRHRD